MGTAMHFFLKNGDIVKINLPPVDYDKLMAAEKAERDGLVGMVLDYVAGFLMRECGISSKKAAKRLWNCSIGVGYSKDDDPPEAFYSHKDVVEANKFDPMLGCFSYTVA